MCHVPAARSEPWPRSLANGFGRLRGAALTRELRVAGRGFAADHPVATGPLGHVERLVRGLDQRLAAVPVAGEDRDAETEREVGNGLAIEQDRLAGDGTADPLGDRQGRPAVGAAQHQDELVAAVAGHEVLGPHGRYQDLPGEVTEDRVAGRVTDGVVDLLEVVDVAHDQGQGLLRLAGSLQLTLEIGFQLAMIRNAGHGIGGGQLLGLLVGGGVLDRDHRLVRERL